MERSFEFSAYLQQHNFLSGLTKKDVKLKFTSAESLQPENF